MNKIPFFTYSFGFILFLLSFSSLIGQETNENLNENISPEEQPVHFYTSYSKPQNAIDGFGYYKLYNNTLNYETNNWYISLGAGLLEQNTIFNNKAPAFSGSLNAYFEYKINNTFSFYLSGQYLTPSFNEEINLQDIYMHPLFPQTELGTGLKGNFNNVTLDVGARTIFNTQLNSQGPSTILNSKLSIGF
ncbi:hypothetical protein DET49_108146 [Salegentibacter sp. 24]|uniref:hypothetical protein n=1 Tax=Salegentibacter sp. 24 TaxID=2183986 RepID=UPI00105F6095|nr:hypothetical protein [Salegentibacter sp. 24]TDN88822.1 hypothetical protein DET49_108146 [Salegentibacter sp. 24]